MLTTKEAAPSSVLSSTSSTSSTVEVRASTSAFARAGVRVKCQSLSVLTPCHCSG